MNNTPKKWTIGLMSGTSMDGIDVAALRTNGESISEYGPTLFFPYEKPFKKQLSSILGRTKRDSLIDSIELELTSLHQDAVLKFLDIHSLSKKDIDLIGFHGHTILHQSPKKYPNGRTWQIGDGQKLARNLGIPVVGDFRSNDISHGGEGAPLVPIFHRTLENRFEKPFAILNIGGVANITYVDDNILIAFDTGPGNAPMDRWIQKHTSQDYDSEGSIARKGKVNQDLLNRWLQNPYFLIQPPKSLDRLDFNEFPEIHSLEDGMATLLAFTALSIKKSLEWCPKQPKMIIAAGGGCHNAYLMESLQKMIDPILLLSMEKVGISSDFLEAQAFAYLAKRSVNNLPFSFPTTTGCMEPLTGGTFYVPNKR